MIFKGRPSLFHDLSLGFINLYFHLENKSMAKVGIKRFLGDVVSMTQRLSSNDLHFFSEAEINLDNGKLRLFIDLEKSSLDIRLQTEEKRFMLSTVDLTNGEISMDENDDLILTWSSEDMSLVYETLKDLIFSLKTYLDDQYIWEQSHLESWYEYLYGTEVIRFWELK